MERHSQFYRPKIRTEMSACHTDGLNQKFSDFFRQYPVILRRNLLDVICLRYLFQQHKYTSYFSL